MSKRGVNATVVSEWALEHLGDKDPTTYNRFIRAAGRIGQLESEVNRLLSENTKLSLRIVSHPILAHRVKGELQRT